MNIIAIFPYYLRWHYSEAIADILGLWKNFLAFVYNFFSIPLLLSNLFSPWQRMGDEYVKGESLGDAFGTFILNTIMRCVGFVMRVIFILLGLATLLFGLLCGFFILALWIALPAVFIYTLTFGINTLV